MDGRKGIILLHFDGFKNMITEVAAVTGNETCGKCGTQNEIYYIYAPESKFGPVKFIWCSPCGNKGWRHPHCSWMKLTDKKGNRIKLDPHVTNKQQQKCIFMHERDFEEAAPYLKKYGYITI